MLALVRVVGEDVCCFEHIIGLLEVVELGEVELLALLGGRVGVFALVAGLGLLIVEYLDEKRDGHALEVSALPLLVDSVLLQVEYISHIDQLLLKLHVVRHVLPVGVEAYGGA